MTRADRANEQTARAAPASRAFVAAVLSATFQGCASGYVEMRSAEEGSARPPPWTSGAASSLRVASASRNARRLGGEPTHAAFHRRVALVIGNSVYADVPQVPNAGNDARGVAEGLTRLGFGVQRHADLGVEELRRVVSNFVEGLHEGDLAVLYYAGHGASVGPHNFLLPADFTYDPSSNLVRQLETNAFALNEFLDRIERLRSVNIVILDACRNNPWLGLEIADTDGGTTRNAAPGPTVGRGFSVVSAPTGSLVVFATAPGTIAYDGGTDPNGPFASSLIRHLADHAEFGVILTRVNSDVRNATHEEQVPHWYGSLNRAVYLTGEGPPLDDASPPVVDQGSPTRASSISPWVWGGGAVAVAGAATAFGLWYDGRGRLDVFTSECARPTDIATERSCSARRDPLVADLNGWRPVVIGVSWGVSALGGLLAVIGQLTHGSSSRHARAVATPWVGPQQAGLRYVW